MKNESFKRAGLTNSVLAACVALSTYASYALIAGVFGTQTGTDIFFFLFSFSTLAASVFTALLPAVLVPTLVRVRVEEGSARSLDLAGAIFSRLLLGLIGVSALCWSQTDLIFEHASRFGEQQLRDGHTVLRYFAPIVLFSVMSEYLRAVVQSGGQYTVPAATALVYPALTLALTLYFARVVGVEILSVALCGSRALQTLLLWIYVHRFGFRLRWAFHRPPHPGRVAKAAGPYWAANLITAFSPFYFDFVASGLSAGILTAISYAQRIYTLPFAVLINPFLDIARTKLSELRSQGNIERFQATYEMLAGRLVIALVPLSLFMVALAPELVKFLFARGAFSDESVRITSNCLRVFALSIPLTALFGLNGRVVESFQRLTWPALFGTVGNLLSVALTASLVASYGYIGVPLSKLTADAIYFLPFGFICVKAFVGAVDHRPLIRQTLAITAASAGAAAVVLEMLAIKGALLDFVLLRLVMGAAVFVVLTAASFRLALWSMRRAGARPT